ncbi:MAG: hypothetical protein LAO19_01440 [Acidobacteriia bacterium]|nr:hypothetical protein [Terriglobia bacterium]
MSTDNQSIPVRRHSLSHLETYDITADELDRIQTECMGTGQDLQFCLVALTTGITCLASLLLTEIISVKIYNGFLVFTVVGFVFALYYAIQYWRKKGNLVSIVQRIKDRQVGPIGEQGHEVRPAELATLPVTTARGEVAVDAYLAASGESQHAPPANPAPEK